MKKDVGMSKGDSSRSKVSRVRVLEQKITQYNEAYYNDEAEVDDSVYDAAINELRELDPSNPLVFRLGADSGPFPKARHVMPMGSLSKVSSVEQFKKWAAKHRYEEYLVEWKLDGASIELQYLEGTLMRAVTRGDGQYGDIISANATRMAGIVESLDVNFTGGIRGEVMMSRTVHHDFYPNKANCRNAANGLMKRKDSKGCEHLTIITYDVWSTTGEQPFSDEEGKLTFLKQCGFKVVPMRICHSEDEVIAYREEMAEQKRGGFDVLDWDIDGLVIKERVVNHKDALLTRPERQIAFKFNVEEAITVLRSVEWSENGTTYTPIATFDPVLLNGTTVERASLANPNLIQELQLGIGSRIKVVKRGEIIPKITEALPGGEGISSIEVPDTCDQCGSKLVNEGTRLYCPNLQCPKRLLHRVKKWVQTTRIKGMGDKLIEGLFNDGKVRYIKDIYALTTEDLAPYFLKDPSLLKIMGSLEADKIIKSIKDKDLVSFVTFVAGFDIDGIGEKMIFKLIDWGYNTLPSIFNAKEEDIAKVDGFGKTNAHTFVQGIAECRDQMQYLLDEDIVNVECFDVNVSKRLTGKTFYFMDDIEQGKRDFPSMEVRRHGGEVKTSIAKGLDYIVTNYDENTNPKLKKAKELGVSVINMREFIMLVDDDLIEGGKPNMDKDPYELLKIILGLTDD